MIRDVTIKNLQKLIRLSPLRLRQTVRKICRHERVASFDLSIVFVSDRTIRSLNKQYLGKDRPTDVLAFDLKGEGALAKNRASVEKSRTTKPSPLTLEGEIIISTDTARAQAVQYKNNVQAEIILYVIHGILHLLGYDDHAAKNVLAMRRKEKELLEYLKLD